MTIFDPRVHISTYPNRHKTLIDCIFQISCSTLKVHEKIRILNVGPGGVPLEFKDKFTGDLSLYEKTWLKWWSKNSAHPLINYEPFELAQTYGKMFSAPEIVVIDSYQPCVSGVTRTLDLKYKEGSFNKSTISKIQAFHHDVCNKLPESYGKFDVIFAAIALDRIVASKQVIALRNLDLVLNPGGSLAITTGYTAPDCSLILGKNYTQKSKHILPQIYQIWQKTRKLDVSTSKHIFLPPKIDYDETKSTPTQPVMRTIKSDNPKYSRIK